jgi:predicted secreted protein
MVKTIVNFIFIFVVTWWIVIFCVLPVGNQREETPESGHDHGAPKNVNFKKKFIITTIISFILTTAYLIAISSGLIDWKTIGYQ